MASFQGLSFPGIIRGTYLTNCSSPTLLHLILLFLSPPPHVPLNYPTLETAFPSKSGADVV